MNDRYYRLPDADESDMFMPTDDMDDFEDFDFDDDLWDDDSPPAAIPDDRYNPPAHRSAAQQNRNVPISPEDFWGDDFQHSGRTRKPSAPARYSRENDYERPHTEHRPGGFPSFPEGRASGRRLLPVPVLILLDCALIGCALLVFALFHHVIPRSGQPEGGYVSTVSFSELPDVFVSASDASVSTDDAPEKEENLPFTESTVVTDTSYHSSNVAVTVTTYTENKLVYHVQDIFVRSPEFFRTAFAKDTYGVWVSEKTPVIAKRNNAICAINGDYYGASSKKGLVIRNGVFYRGNGTDTDDILLLLADGSMEVHTAQTYNEDEVLKKNIWQSWSFGPSLLDENGHALEHFDSEIAGKNPRSVVGYFEPGHYCFISVEGRSKESQGLSFVDLAALCESLGCKIAYNLDGGKTSMMTFGDKLVNDAYQGGRECSDILYICDPSAEDSSAE